MTFSFEKNVTFLYNIIHNYFIMTTFLYLDLSELFSEGKVSVTEPNIKRLKKWAGDFNEGRFILYILVVHFTLIQLW